MQLTQLLGKTAKPLDPEAPQNNAAEQMAESAILQTDQSDIVTMLRFSTCYPNFFIDQSLFR